MGGRAVEGTGLENRQTLAGLVGSNPTPSASLRWAHSGHMGYRPYLRHSDNRAPNGLSGGCRVFCSKEVLKTHNLAKVCREDLASRIAAPVPCYEDLKLAITLGQHRTDRRKDSRARIVCWDDDREKRTIRFALGEGGPRLHMYARALGQPELGCLRLRWSLCQSWTQALARQVELVMQPLPQRYQRRPVAQARRVDKVVGMRVFVGYRNR